MFKLFKRQQPATDKGIKVKSNKDSGDDCPMCHIPQEVIDQLKKDDCCQSKRQGDKDCCKK